MELIERNNLKNVSVEHNFNNEQEKGCFCPEYRVNKAME